MVQVGTNFLPLFKTECGHDSSTLQVSFRRIGSRSFASDSSATFSNHAAFLGQPAKTEVNCPPVAQMTLEGLLCSQLFVGPAQDGRNNSVVELVMYRKVVRHAIDLKI